MIKKIVLVGGIFVVGVITGAAAFYLLFWRDAQRGAAMLYANAFEAQVDTALKVRVGEQERFLRDFESSLPEDVEAVRYFGDYDFVQSALRKAEEYYKVTGGPVPESVATAIASLPAEKTVAEKHKASKQEKVTRLKVGDPAPLLVLQSIDGRALDLRQKVVMLNFFATWCGPCLREMSRLQKDIGPLQGKGVLLVAIGREHSAGELGIFQKEKSFSFPFVADPKREIYDQFATEYIPQCVLIGKDGLIKYQTVGFAVDDYALLLKAVESELAR